MPLCDSGPRTRYQSRSITAILLWERRHPAQTQLLRTAGVHLRYGPHSSGLSNECGRRRSTKTLQGLTRCRPPSGSANWPAPSQTVLIALPTSDGDIPSTGLLNVDLGNDCEPVGRVVVAEAVTMWGSWKTQGQHQNVADSSKMRHKYAV